MALFRLESIALLFGLAAGASLAPAQAPPAARPSPPACGPHTLGYVSAIELPDGSIPPANADGNFIIGPTYQPTAEMSVHEGVPQGKVYEFTMNSADSQIYPGIARDAGTFGTPDPSDPAKLLVTTSHPAPYTRQVAVYVPKQYVPGSAAPFVVGADGPDRALFIALDNLIAERRVPVMIAISIGNGGGDAQGSERGLEYDTMSGRYAELVAQTSCFPRSAAFPAGTREEPQTCKRRRSALPLSWKQNATLNSPRTPMAGRPWVVAPAALAR